MSFFEILAKEECGENILLLSFLDMSAEENTPARPILRRRYLLTCGITSLRPNTQITWFKDGQPFNANNDRVRFIDNKRGVLFTSLLEQDNGEYMCIANYGSSRASYTTTVNAAEEKLHGKQTFKFMYDIYNIKHTIISFADFQCNHHCCLLFYRNILSTRWARK